MANGESVFRIGTPVFLRNRASQDVERIGTVVNVIPSDSALYDFALYDVDFASGLHTLHGSALRPVPIGIWSCDEKEYLLVAHKKHSTSICGECENWRTLPE